MQRTMRNRCAHQGMRCVRVSFSSFLRSLVWSTTSPADLYISRRVSHFRHYHFCRGGVRTRHTRPAVRPSWRVPRRPEAAIRSRVHARLRASLTRVHPLAPCVLPHRSQWCGFFDAVKRRIIVSPLNFKSRSYVLLHAGVREGFIWDMYVTWIEPEDPPAAGATEWD